MVDYSGANAMSLLQTPIVQKVSYNSNTAGLFCRKHLGPKGGLYFKLGCPNGK